MFLFSKSLHPFAWSLCPLRKLDNSLELCICNKIYSDHDSDFTKIDFFYESLNRYKISGLKLYLVHSIQSSWIWDFWLTSKGLEKQQPVKLNIFNYSFCKTSHILFWLLLFYLLFFFSACLITSANIPKWDSLKPPIYRQLLIPRKANKLWAISTKRQDSSFSWGFRTLSSVVVLLQGWYW